MLAQLVQLELSVDPDSMDLEEIPVSVVLLEEMVQLEILVYLELLDDLVVTVEREREVFLDFLEEMVIEVYLVPMVSPEKLELLA